MNIQNAYTYTPPKKVRESNWFDWFMRKIGDFGGDRKARWSPWGGCYPVVRMGWKVDPLNLIIWKDKKYKE